MRASRIERVAGVELTRHGTWHVEGTDTFILDGQDRGYSLVSWSDDEERRLETTGWSYGMALSIGEARAIVEAAFGPHVRIRLAFSKYLVTDLRWEISRLALGGEWVVSPSDVSPHLSFGGRTRWATRRGACEAISSAGFTPDGAFDEGGASLSEDRE